MNRISGVFGGNVRLHRRRNGWTQERLAEACDVSTVFIGQIENGKKNPSFDLIERLSRALKVSYSSLFLTSRPTRNVFQPELVLEDDVVRRVVCAIHESFDVQFSPAVQRPPRAVRQKPREDAMASQDERAG